MEIPGLTRFSPGVAERLKHYVYLLIDPRDNRVFYVGKGTGDRCFAHVAAADLVNTIPGEDEAKLGRIKAIQQCGKNVRIDILRHGLEEHEAFLVESVAIDLVDGLTNEVKGHDGAELGRIPVEELNIRYGAVPVTINPEHRVVLIRINRLFQRGMSDPELYEATRKWWRIGGPKRQIGAPSAPQWAMAVFGGIVRAVYRIESWERPSAEDIDADPKRARRWAFRGSRDQAMESMYGQRDVSAYLRSIDTGNAIQNPIRYVNCQGDPTE